MRLTLEENVIGLQILYRIIIRVKINRVVIIYGSFMNRKKL